MFALLGWGKPGGWRRCEGRTLIYTPMRGFESAEGLCAWFWGCGHVEGNAGNSVMWERTGTVGCWRWLEVAMTEENLGFFRLENGCQIRTKMPIATISG